jgi:hypothetical protein
MDDANEVRSGCYSESDGCGDGYHVDGGDGGSDGDAVCTGHGRR